MVLKTAIYQSLIEPAWLTAIYITKLITGIISVKGVQAFCYLNKSMLDISYAALFTIRSLWTVNLSKYSMGTQKERNPFIDAKPEKY